jgi:ubiquitin carboxyl-terminal hydrolase 2/21
MSDLIPYNEKYVPAGQGLINLGSTCYFNSLFQCLLSCPSIYATLQSVKDKKYVKENRLAQNMMKLWDSALKGERIYDLCIPIWQDIINISRAKNNRVQMDNGQQDVHEGLMMFFDAMETIPEVRRLFEHRHRMQILCDTCNEVTVDKKESNLVFEVQPDLKMEQIERFQARDEFYQTVMTLNDFLKRQNGYADKDFKCPKKVGHRDEVETNGKQIPILCGALGEKFRITTLTMVPEILPVVIKKYYKKINTPFPSRLQFSAKGSSQIFVYDLVAQSEHSGSMNGGHYWAICKRSDGWQNLNDGSVSPGTAGPTDNSYVIFYHYAGTINADDVDEKGVSRKA